MEYINGISRVRILRERAGRETRSLSVQAQVSHSGSLWGHLRELTGPGGMRTQEMSVNRLSDRCFGTAIPWSRKPRHLPAFGSRRRPGSGFTASALAPL